MKGLVLEGGGAKGAYHCGAVKALYDSGYVFDGVAGTSIGAINAAMIVQDGGYKTLWKAWSEVSAADIAGISREHLNALLNKNFSVQLAEYWAKEIVSVLKNAGVPTDYLLSFLKKYIDEDKLRSSSMDYALVTYCLTDRASLELFKEDIPTGSLHEYILASAYYPLFRLDRLGGKYYLDGGIHDNLPIGVLAARGYEDIIAVRTKSRPPRRPVINPDVRVRYIVPSEKLGSTIDPSEEKMEKNKKTGYFDAMRMINGYAGQKYYVKRDGKTAGEILSQLSDKEVDEITAKTSATMISYGLQTNDPSDALIAYVEPLATSLKAEKFKVYEEEQYFEMLKDAFLPKRERNLSFFSKSKENELYEKIIRILRRHK